VRDAREEARVRVGGRHDVRVLEPSPPAVDAAPFFADDPLDGGTVLPIERAGARTWAEIAEGDADLSAWCADRWLIRRPLAPLPPSFNQTRHALHVLAEHVLAPARHAANGKIGLRFTYHGFGTPFFADDRQIRVEDDTLRVGDDRHELTTLRAATELLGLPPRAPNDVYTPTTAPEPDDELGVDPFAARALGDWFGYCASLLEQLRADASADDAAARVQIWPEHFDIAVDLGPEGSRANFGGSPGDGEHAEPYLYVGPWGAHDDATFWNESFGASLSYSEIAAGGDGLAFLREGKERVCRQSG
jgi:hypothetical protein